MAAKPRTCSASVASSPLWWRSLTCRAGRGPEHGVERRDRSTGRRADAPQSSDPGGPWPVSGLRRAVGRLAAGYATAPPTWTPHRPQDHQSGPWAPGPAVDGQPARPGTSGTDGYADLMDRLARRYSGAVGFFLDCASGRSTSGRHASSRNASVVQPRRDDRRRRHVGFPRCPTARPMSLRRPVGQCS